MGHIGDGMAKGIGYGTLAVTGTLLLAMVGEGTESVEWQELAYIPFAALFVSFFAFFIVALAAIAAGLPIVWMLRKADCASAGVVGILGAVVGAAVFLLPALGGPGPVDEALVLFAFVGLVGGGVTGWVWGEAQEQASEIEQPAIPANRIDDPRILR